MKFTVHLLPSAIADSDHIYLWIAKHSPQGAVNWYAALLSALDELKTAADRFGLATEIYVDDHIRQMFFRTLRGRRYRLLFKIETTSVYVLRIRGPGQRPLTRNDI